MGSLSGYHAKAFTISPPRIDRVVERRLRFARRLTSGEIPIESLPGGVQIRLENLGRLISVFLDSLNQNSDLAECIDNIAGGNVRLALDIVRGFFGSGHVDTEKIIHIYDESGRYTIPLHEFLRAVIFGDAEYYDPDSSPVANLFDTSRLDSREHFLLSLVIGILTSTRSTEAEQGFVETGAIYEGLQRIGFSPEQIDNAIVRGHRKKLIESTARRIPQPGREMPQSLRVTTVGAYQGVLKILCK